MPQTMLSHLGGMTGFGVHPPGFMKGFKTSLTPSRSVVKHHPQQKCDIPTRSGMLQAALHLFPALRRVPWCPEKVCKALPSGRTSQCSPQGRDMEGCAAPPPNIGEGSETSLKAEEGAWSPILGRSWGWDIMIFNDVMMLWISSWYCVMWWHHWPKHWQEALQLWEYSWYL